MKHITRCITALAILASFATAGRAEPWTVTWDGNDYPENEGWYRDLWGPPDIRTLNPDSTMTLDTRQTVELWDTYLMWRPLNPGPGETFFLTFRVRVSEITGGIDPGVWFKTDNFKSIDFLLSMDHVEIPFFITIAQFEPGVFHTFECLSSDMQTFRFFVDDQFAYEGNFLPSGYQSTMAWGDIVYGASSLATWDFLSFGVVPEVSTGLLLVVLPLIRRRTCGQPARQRGSLLWSRSLTDV
jgi:hypothetical protein